jgi:predicted nuclease of predicted toxin-antitoxin system
MKIRFQADADLNRNIVLATLRHEPALDFQTANDAGLTGLEDPEVLAVAARLGRILITHDGRTMPHHFAAFVKHTDSPGVLVLPQHVPVAVAAEELFLVWLATAPEEWANQICWIPM